MDEDVFNMQVRKFLKNVGVTSQREIEQSVRDAVAAGKVAGDASLTARVTLEIADVGLSKVIEGEIDLK